MSPKVPESYLEARRKEIIEAASKCFAEKGFHNTTMQDIYETANLSPGAVYNYFSSKEDIVVATIAAFSEWSISWLESVVSENPDDSFLKIIQSWITLIKQEIIGRGISVQLDYYSEASRNKAIREAVLKSQDATHAKLIEIIKQNQQWGVINAKLEPLAIARTLMGIMFGMMIHKSLEPEVDIDTYGQVCEAIFNGTFSRVAVNSRRAE
jgi:AcrR family transcriptional regulator